MMNTSRPNILLINCDDLGYGDLGCYGSTANDTPFIDQLAAEGMRFTDFYMASSVCSPSRGAMMTGCYPPRISFGVFPTYGRRKHDAVLFPGDDVGLNPDEITIARLLKDLGYATALVGKWHCGDQREFLPTSHGFDHYFGLPYSNDMGRQDGNPQGHPPLPLLRDAEVVEEQPDQTTLTERYVESCVSFIRQNQNQPFFLYLAHMHVHVSHYAPERFLKESRNGRYGAAVACVDWATGVLMSELRRLGLEENTIIVFTSDNGSRARDEGGSNAPLHGTKATCWEGGQRVPCIVRWPQEVQRGTQCDDVTSAMDFLPTFAAAAGTEVPNDRILDGRNVLPLWKQETTLPLAPFFYYFRNNLNAVREGRWKLHVGRNGATVAELHDLEFDIGELRNVYGDHPDVVERLSGLLDAGRKDIGDAATQTVGENVRPIGKVERAEPLTEYDPVHPYMVAMYDLPQRG